MPEYETWCEETGADAIKGWTIKYYKGLGTSTSAYFKSHNPFILIPHHSDAKKYFSNMQKHVRPFAPCREEDRVQLDLAFSKKKADERKEWLSGYVVC